MSGEIPTYNHPTIAEALCEIHFDAEDSTGIDLETYDKIKQIIKDDFPTFDDQNTQDYEAAVGPKGMSVKPIGPAAKRRIFKHKNRGQLVQVNPKILTVNELAAYPGWKVFEPDIYFALNSLEKAAQIKSLNRIGLRYINTIPRDKTEPVGNWLKENEYYPSGILKSVNKFASRFEFRLDNEVRSVVTVAEGLDPKGNLPILFDIDCIFESEIPIGGKEVSSALHRLRTLSWDVFGKSLTDRYKKYLNEGV